MAIALRVIAALALVYGAWIVFRVADDWLGAVAGVVAVLLLPLTMPLFAVLMLFVSTGAAGPLSLWLPIGLIGFLDWVARKNNVSLLIRW